MMTMMMMMWCVYVLFIEVLCMARWLGKCSRNGIRIRAAIVRGEVLTVSPCGSTMMMMMMMMMVAIVAFKLATRFLSAIFIMSQTSSQLGNYGKSKLDQPSMASPSEEVTKISFLILLLLLLAVVPIILNIVSCCCCVAIAVIAR